MRRKTSWFLLLGIALVLSAKASFAQTATLTGTVNDPTGSVIPNAKVTATLTQKNIPFETATDGTGRYLLQNLPIGDYAVEVTVAGFKTFRQSGVELTVDSRQMLNIQLEMGSASQTIEVHGGAVRVDTVSATVQQLVDSRRTNELPLNGRNVYQLSQLVAGVLPASGTGAGGWGFSNSGVGSIGGGRTEGIGATSVNVRIDGALNVDQAYATILPAPLPDAVQEFTIQTSVPSAKYTYSAGVVEIATKSGTNQLHGTLYDFFRNDALDARNFFGATKTKRRRNQYGFTLGGPVRLPGYDGRNRSFFFVGFEQQKEPLQSLTTLFVPTAAQRMGDFSGFSKTIKDPLTGVAFPDNVIPSDRLDPLGVNLLNEYVPMPQDDSGKYTYFMPASSNPTQFVVRGDHAQGNNLFSWRTYWNEVEADTAFGNLPTWAGAGKRPEKSALHTFSWTRSLTPQTANVFRFSYNKWGHGVASDFQIGTPDKLLDLGWSENFVNGLQPDSHNFFPVLAVSGFMNFAFVTPRVWVTSNTFTFEDDFSMVRGRHNLEMGTRVMRAYQSADDTVVRSMGSFTFNGTYTGSALTDFMLGRPSLIDQQNIQNTHGLQTTLGFYAQDNIKVHRRLSLNFGLRYDLPLSPVERDGHESVFRPWTGQQSTVFPNAPVGLLFHGDSGVANGIRGTNMTNFGPRVGLVYALTEDQKTVLRAGYGRMYNPVWMNLNEGYVAKQPWVTRVQRTAPPSTSDPWADYPGGSPFPASVYTPDYVFTDAITFTYEPEYDDPYMDQWNLNLQKEIAKDWLVTAAYVGTKGTHLGTLHDYNAAEYIAGSSTLANLNSRRPYYPPLTTVVMYNTGGNSTYHSMQLTLDKRFGHGFSLLAAYTLSKAICNQDNGATGDTVYNQDPDNFLGLEKAISAMDRTHAFVSSVVWTLPQLKKSNRFARQLLGGWTLTTILKMYSGTPLGMTASTDNALRGSSNRPNKLGNPVLSSDRPLGEKLLAWFDTSAYAANGTGEFGTAPRTDPQLRGPGMVVLDFGVLKDFRFTERHRLQFRAEFFNLPNHANFSNPSTNFNASSFGRITAAGDPRIIQFALKYSF